jgi:hypothetical protein
VELLHEVCAWLRGANRDRSGEELAEEIEAAYPEVEKTMRAAHPGYLKEPRG